MRLSRSADGVSVTLIISGRSGEELTGLQGARAIHNELSQRHQGRARDFLILEVPRTYSNSKADADEAGGLAVAQVVQI
jgi:hypothetical protein